jgi:hypothetical protein
MLTRDRIPIVCHDFEVAVHARSAAAAGSEETSAKLRASTE